MVVFPTVWHKALPYCSQTRINKCSYKHIYVFILFNVSIPFSVIVNSKRLHCDFSLTARSSKTFPLSTNPLFQSLVHSSRSLFLLLTLSSLHSFLFLCLSVMFLFSKEDSFSINFRFLHLVCRNFFIEPGRKFTIFFLSLELSKFQQTVITFWHNVFRALINKNSVVTTLIIVSSVWQRVLNFKTRLSEDSREAKVAKLFSSSGKYRRVNIFKDFQDFARKNRKNHQAHILILTANIRSVREKRGGEGGEISWLTWKFSSCSKQCRLRTVSFGGSFGKLWSRAMKAYRWSCQFRRRVLLVVNFRDLSHTLFSLSLAKCPGHEGSHRGCTH